MAKTRPIAVTAAPVTPEAPKVKLTFEATRQIAASMSRRPCGLTVLESGLFDALASALISIESAEGDIASVKTAMARKAKYVLESSTPEWEADQVGNLAAEYKAKKSSLSAAIDAVRPFVYALKSSGLIPDEYTI